MTTQLTAPFVFYNGAFFPVNYSPLGVWVKYRPGPNRVEAVSRSSGWVHVSCPDRELLLVRNAHTVNAPRPLDGDWDEFVPLSLHSTFAARSNPIDRYMINYFQHTTLRGQKDGIARASDALSPGIRKPGCLVDDGKVCLTDSGGFQLLTGKADWIDPVDVARWYRENCDEGITLDVPMPIFLAGDPEVLTRAARVQANNTRILLDNLPDTFHLFNVVHGHGEAAPLFREIVEEDGPDDYLCVAGVYHGDVLQSLQRLCGQILDERFKSYRQYHVLGIYGPGMLIPIIRWANLMRKNGHTFTISSDASTPVYTATTRMIHLQRAHYKNAERLAVGRASTVPVPVQNPYRHLPCGCPVCRTIKYVDVVSHFNDSIIPHMLITHNMIEIDRWVKMVNHHAATLDAKDFYELSVAQTAGSPAERSIRTALRFVEMVAGEGLPAAEKQFKQLLHSMFTTSIRSDEESMFVDPDSQDALDSMPVDAARARIDTILQRYEDYHADAANTPKSTTKRSEAKRTAKKVMMNSAVKRAGRAQVTRKRKPRAAEHSTTSTHAKKRPAAPAAAK